MSVEIVNEAGELLATIPAGARQLGVRVKPIIRLGMGYRDEQRRGAPVKTDYFTVRGDDRAIAKFYAEYGEKPKAVDILLPTELDIALTIQYRAFKGAHDGEGGTLVAVGHTNFALRDYMGGPDLVTHFAQDGTVEELETLGVDANTREPLDEVAKGLGLELYTTLRAGMPNVLGFGSYFEISTKGKQSTDALWAKLRELYGLFGSKITFAVKPQLVLRPSTARPVVVNRETQQKKRTTTTIYALDIVVPETIDNMIDRLAQRQAALAPDGAAAALYGRELGSGSSAVPAADDAPARADVAADSGGAADDDPYPAPAGEGPDEEDGVWVALPSEEEVAAAAALVVPRGVHKDKTLAEVAELEQGPAWLLRQLKSVPTEAPDREKIETFVQARLPGVWGQYEEWRAEQDRAA